MGKEDKNVLVDTSAWIEFFRGTAGAADTVAKVIESGRAYVCGVIYFELLQGMKAGENPVPFIELLKALNFIETTADMWIRAGNISAGLRKTGVTIPMSDLLIGAAAIEHGLYVLTHDEHFSSIPGIRLYRQ